MKRNKTQGAGVAKRSAVHRKTKRTRVYKQKPSHAKPFRLRHIILLLISLGFCLILILQLGIQMGRDNLRSNTLIPPQSTQKQTSGLTIVRSSYGFSLATDANSFSVAATIVDGKGNAKSIPVSDLRSTEPINSLIIKPLPGTESGPAAAAQVSVQVNPDTNALTQLKSQPANANKTDGEIATIAFPISQNIGFNTAVVSSTPDTLNGVAVQKTIYQYTSKIGSNTTTYEVNWAGSVGGRLFVLRLQGLVGGSATPDLLQPLIDSFNIDNSKKVLGASIDNMGSLLFPKAFAAKAKPLDTKYISDLVSPSVVKIYHILCYGVGIDGSEVFGYGCDLSTGSGFIASSDGYIATNGHVVDSDPTGTLVQLITSSPTGFTRFVTFLNIHDGLGLSPTTIAEIAASPQAQADIIAKIYELPAGTIKLENKHERVIVALGNKPPDIKTPTQLEKIVDNFDDTDFLKTADIKGLDFSSKDLNVNLYSGKGFESNDVALLKVKINNAPALSMISGSQISQNQSAMLIGYPGDAENLLVNNDTLSPSITNGTISSIRDASGKSGKLFQTNADASHGNSGGPAVTDSGQVFGLLTYRYQDPEAGDAAKSYIRDIKGFQDLVSSKNVNLSSDNKTQVAWAKGLELFSESHLSAAVKQFDEVKSLYPAHTMVGSYIERAQDGIKQGKDIKGIPMVLILVGIGVTTLGVAAAVVFMIVHRKRHSMFKANQQALPATPPTPLLPVADNVNTGTVTVPTASTVAPSSEVNIPIVQTVSEPQPISQIVPPSNIGVNDVLPPTPPPQNGQ